MIDLRTFNRVVEELRRAGYADADIQWAENCAPPTTAEAFAREAIFVICNSGMKNTVAREIFRRVIEEVERGESASNVFNHEGKACAINTIWRDRIWHFSNYLAAADKLRYLESLPYVGRITKFHLAKNFGMQVAKPDVHLTRLAALEGCTAQALCERLSRESGYKVATVDVLLWRACAQGIIDSKTGAVRVNDRTQG